MATPSLEELEREIFIYPDGSTASFKNIASTARIAPDNEEQRYIKDVQEDVGRY